MHHLIECYWICHEYIIFNYYNIILFFCKNVYDDNINHSNKLNTKIKDMSYNNQNSINFIVYRKKGGYL